MNNGAERVGVTSLELIELADGTLVSPDGALYSWAAHPEPGLNSAVAIHASDMDNRSDTSHETQDLAEQIFSTRDRSELEQRLRKESIRQNLKRVFKVVKFAFVAALFTVPSYAYDAIADDPDKELINLKEFPNPQGMFADPLNDIDNFRSLSFEEMVTGIYNTIKGED